jgi:nitroreductase
VLSGGHVWHYDASRHALEERCAFEVHAWTLMGLDPARSFLVALTSVHWRESWKYGERAFRYCQHDAGHAIAALRIAAALCGWRLSVRPCWTHQQVGALTGVDRDADFFEAEREDAACLMLVTDHAAPEAPPKPTEAFVRAVREGRWTGRASQLSTDHVQWTFIDEVAQATSGVVESGASAPPPPAVRPIADRELDAAALILQRRSAVALDRHTRISRQAFLAMLGRTMPSNAAPWDALWWPPRIHLALFVHRVEDVEPGLYLLARSTSAEPRLRSSITHAFEWAPADDDLPLWRLEAGDHRRLAQRVSCDQEIAADGCFSLAMLADFNASLQDHGAAFYRHLFWETGVIGQVLYLEAEAAGIRSTGIGCFYDDAVHDLLGIRDHSFQSLYHFTVGGPVDDARLTTEPGYEWELQAGKAGGAGGPGRSGRPEGLCFLPA